MARVEFTPNLRRHLSTPSVEVDGTSVREVLDIVFDKHETLRGYILDEHGKLRKHVVVFVDGDAITDRVSLSDAVGSNTEIFVMQALSGG